MVKVKLERRQGQCESGVQPVWCLLQLSQLSGYVGVNDITGRDGFHKVHVLTSTKECP